ncbi:hypothetical protein [Promicromonospora aerolata]|uniref:Uncharacterized protein n=1 Tax=Promicromonospora aerolata TaxID=195749 RepID=A0ABW4VBJ4_9MICO
MARGQAEAAFDVLDPLDDPPDEDPDELDEPDDEPELSEDEPLDELDEPDDESDEDSPLPDFTVLFVEVLRESVR